MNSMLFLLRMFDSERGRFIPAFSSNEENQIFGGNPIDVAMVVSTILYAVPRRLPVIFPRRNDGYPLSNERVRIGNAVRNYLSQRPKLNGLITLVNDTFFITVGLLILAHNRLAQKSFIYKVSIFVATCEVVLTARVALSRFLEFSAREIESDRIRSIVSEIAELILPSYSR